MLGHPDHVFSPEVVELLSCWVKKVFSIEFKSAVIHPWGHSADAQPKLVHGAKFQGKF